MKNTFGKQFLKVSRLSKANSNKIRLADKAFNPWFSVQEFLAGWCLAGMFALLLIFPLSAFATSPSDIQLSYLEKEQILQVTITHKSFVPNYHYIKEVKIRKNSEKFQVYEYKNQPDKETFVYTYKLPLEKGDRVEIRVICSLYGSGSDSLVIAFLRQGNEIKG